MGWRVGVALVAMLAAASATAAADDARDWILRMNTALERRNYEGLLTHRSGPVSETLHIIHRWQDGRMSERVRVIPQNGAALGREYVRNGSEWIAYYPEERRVLVQTRNRSYGYLIALNGLRADSTSYYDIVNGGTVRLKGRPAQHVALEPRDDLRYGYRFWLDPKSALPLQTQLVSRSGQVIEEISFLDGITLLDKVAEERLKPEFDASKFSWKRRDVPMYTPGMKKVFTPRSELLPAGFQTRLFTSPEEEARAVGPRTRFIVSDGIAWVSVFVERVALGYVMGPKDRNWVMGSTATYVAMRDGFTITVVGEAPPVTVKAIAEAVRSD